MNEKSSKKSSDEAQFEEFVNKFKNYWKNWWNKQDKKEFKRAARISEAFFTILANIIIYALVNTFYDDMSFLSGDFEDVLPIINLGIAINIITHTFRLFIHSNWFKSLVNIINNSFAIYIFLKIRQVFPFDVSDGVETAFKIFIPLAIFGLCIAIIVELVKFTKNISKASV